MPLTPSIPRRPLGKSGVQVPVVGLGCMSMTDVYGKSDKEEAQRTLKAALELGCTFWDTADIYGQDGANEKLLAPFLKDHREKIFLCTKFGFFNENGKYGLRGDPQYVQEACEKSLERLGVETIDLYYQHRVDRNVPIEETVGAMKKLQEQGKVKYLGLSECTAETLRRALKVARIDAVQVEYSPWTLDIETNGLLEACKENNVTVVAYSPLGRGMLSGTIRSVDDLPPDDWRRTNPRFQGEAFEANLKLVDAVVRTAEQMGEGVTAAQVTLAWILKQSDNVIVIPGTQKEKRLRENVVSGVVRLSDEEDKEFRKLISEIEIVGERYHKAGMAILDQ